MEEKTFIHFCDECQTEREFDIIDLQETFTIKGVSLTATHKYEQCKICEELFEPHNDIDRNIKEDYRLYREYESSKLTKFIKGGSTSCSSPEKQKEFDESSGTISVLEWCIGTGEDKKPQWYHNKIFPDIKRKDAFEYATELNNKYKTYMRKLGAE